MKKRGLFFIILIFQAAGVWAQFAGGDGSVTNPFQISNAQQLDFVRNYSGNASTGLHFRIMNNINLENYINTKYPAVGWLPLPDFRGNLHGGGNRISGLWINRPTMDKVGLFASLTGAKLDSLGVRSSSAGILGKNKVGGFVGETNTNSYIYNCYGIIDIVAEGFGVGGLVGWNSGSTIEKCYTKGTVKSNYVSGNNYVGGVVGENTSGSSLLTCFSNSDVYGNMTVGGLAGESFFGVNFVSDCYSTGKVTNTGPGYIGGFIGYVSGTTISSCFYDSQTSGQPKGSGGSQTGITGKTTAEMQQQSTFAGWDFNTVWRITNGQTYPVFDCMMPIQGKSAVCNKSREVFEHDDLLKDFQWSISGGGTILNGENTYQTLVDWNTSGTYTLRLAYHGSNHCMATNSPITKIVSVNPLPTFTLSSMNMCPGTIDLASLINNASPNSTMHYYNDAAASNELPSSVINNLSSTTTFYFRSYNNLTQCWSAVQSVTISVYTDKEPSILIEIVK